MSLPRPAWLRTWAVHRVYPDGKRDEDVGRVSAETRAQALAKAQRSQSCAAHGWATFGFSVDVSEV